MNSQYRVSEYGETLNISNIKLIFRSDVEKSCEYKLVKRIFVSEGITIICEFAFSDFESLTEINLPNTLRSISFFAFRNCNSISNIALPEGLLKVDRNSFSDMKLLSSLTIPSSIVTFSCTFENCPSLSYISVNKSNSYFSDINNTFLVSKDLTELIACSSNLKQAFIPKGIKNILMNTFKNREYLEEVKFLSNDIISVGPGAFQGCRNLRKFEMKNSIQFIHENAFANTRLSYLVILEKLSYIGANAFQNCKFLKTIVVTHENPIFYMQNGVLSNKNNTAIYAITQGTKSLNIHKTVKFIPKGTLSSCSSLANVTVERGNNVYSSINNLIFNPFKKELVAIPGGTDGKIVVPSNIEIIGQRSAINSQIKQVSFENNYSKLKSIRDYAFKNSSIEIIDFPPTLLSINECAFENCIHLRNISIPSSVNFIGRKAFKNARSLEYVKYDSTASIPIECFHNCINLKEINFNKNIGEINSRAFENCLSLENLEVNCSLLKSDSFSRCAKLKTVKLDETDTIDHYSFSNCLKLDEIYIPDSLVKIGICAFYNCPLLQKIILPKHSHLTNIGHGAFSLCNIDYLTLSSNIEKIGDGAFSGCPLNIILTEPDCKFYAGSGVIYNKDCTELITVGSSVINLGLPGTLKNIRPMAFSCCQKLRVLWFNVDCQLSNLDSNILFGAESLFYLTLPSSLHCLEPKCFKRFHNLRQVTFLGNSQLEMIPTECFCGLKNLTKIVFEGKTILKSIGFRAFGGCCVLFYFQIPSTVIYLHERAFEKCSLLSYINLPVTLKFLAPNTFWDCTALSSVTYAGQSNFEESNGAFKNTMVKVIVVSQDYKGNTFAGIPAIRLSRE